MQSRGTTCRAKLNDLSHCLIGGVRRGRAGAGRQAQMGGCHKRHNVTITFRSRRKTQGHTPSKAPPYPPLQIISSFLEFDCDIVTPGENPCGDWGLSVTIGAAEIVTEGGF